MKIIFTLLMSLVLFASDYSSMLKSFEEGNTNRAIFYTRVNATQGNSNAMYDLGLLYYSLGDIEKANYWFENSLKNGGKGEIAISLILFSKGEYENVLELLKSSKSSKSMKIRNALMDVSQDFTENKNDASSDSYLLLSKLFFRNKIVHLDTKLALFLVDIAAKKGNSEALEIMGDAYNIIRKSTLKAPLLTNSLSISLEYYKQASNLGNNNAMAKIGEIYITGPRSIRMVQYGVEFIKRSANGGSTLGAKLLGDLYLNGQDGSGLGLKRDIEEALVWYKKAAGICEVNSNLVSAYDYAQYYNNCQEESSIISEYHLLFEDF